MPQNERTYIAIDLKSYYASVECMERGLDPMQTNLVVADPSRTEKTICLAVSPALKAYGIPGRARLFEVVERVRQVNAERQRPRARRAADRKERGRPRAEGRRVPRGRLSGGAAAHGEIHRGQYADLRHLSQVRLSRGYPHLLHRRGADGRYRLSGDLPHDRSRAGEGP